MRPAILILSIFVTLLVVLAAYLNGSFGVAQRNGPEEPIPEVVDYNFHIKPILSDKCYTCHGPDEAERKAGLRLDLEESAFAELSESPGQYAIVAGNPRTSAMYTHIVSEDPDMVMPPPDSQLSLTEHEKKLIRKWIEQGAKFERHWAFIAPAKAPLPKVTDTTWPRNDIDYYVLQKMGEKNLNPSPEAPPLTLLRRMALDVTGLPPSPGLVARLGDSPNEYDWDGIIDSLLASPAYAERMTQSWLDVARYADSHGYQDDSYRTMWPWRDWVIHAFATNMPYDRFLTWQLAGDLLPEATPEQILATAFNRNHPITQEGGVIQEEYRVNYVLDRTNTLGKGILGITMECARCHDHKYDAISQKDYFGMFAFFNQVNEKGIQMDAVQAARQKLYADPPVLTITDAETKGILDFINLPADMKEIKVMVMNDSAPKQAFVLDRGEYDRPTDSVHFDTPTRILPYPADFPKNRLGLAQWVVSRDNPLTARVFVNRLWGMIFGRGLVETVEDFGVQGSLPTHPELLDYLAVDFMEHEWDIRYLIKEILRSATYRQVSEATPLLQERDPENKWLARASRFRLSGEMIRDYVLASSGLLNREIGGPSVKPYQPAGLWEETNAGGFRGILTQYVPDTGDKLYRRSLYTFWKRTLPPASMTIFDAPTRDFCEVRRQRTNTPLQALAMQNDVQVLEASRVLAQQIVADGGFGDGVAEVFHRILIRDPMDPELKSLRTFYGNTLDRLKADTDTAEDLLAVGEYPATSTDLPETAALMLTAQVIYNLDETITKE